MKRVLTTLIPLIIFFIPNGILGKEQQQVFVSYSLPDAEKTPRLIKELKPGENPLPGDYNVTTKLSFKTEKKDVIYESMKFEPSENNRSSNEGLQSGWNSLGNTYSWKPGRGKDVLTIPLLPQSDDKNTYISDSDELFLDYNDLISENPSLLSLKMKVSREESDKKQATVIIDGKQLVPLKSSNLPSTLWKEKGISYLAKRTFELPHDSSWNYIRKSKHFFFQNRFHLNLNTVDTIDIHFKADASREKINSLTCNLRIGFESLIFPTKNMKCGWFPKRIFKSNGHVVLRIRTGNLFRSEFIIKKKAFLDEIIFMISSKKLKNIQEQPVASIQFRSLRKSNTPNKDTTQNNSDGLDQIDQTFYFQAPIETLSSKRKRLIFPLEELEDEIGRIRKIESITFSIQPTHWDAPAELNFQGFRRASHHSEHHPAIFNVGKNLSARWGGPFYIQDESSEQIEWIEVRNFFSFNAPITSQDRKLTASLKGEPERSNLNVISDSIDFRGIKVQGQNGFDSWHADKDGLKLEGSGNWVEIDWPMQTNFDKNTWFFVNFGAGKENILDLKIIPITENRELSPITILPNKPKKLKGLNENVKELKIKIFLHSSPYILQLKEMVVFQPLLLKPSHTLDSPTLIERETLLVPQKVQTQPREKVNIYKGHLSAPLWPQKEGIPSELSWTTDVGRRMNRVQGLKIMFKVPPTMHVNNPCWLQFTLVSTNHEVNQSICSEDSTNQILFSTDKLFHGINFQNDEILKQISWKILAKNRVNLKTQPLPIDFVASIIGYDIRTIRSELLRHPVMDWNGTTLFATSMEGLSKGDKFSHNYATRLGVVSVKDKSKANLFFNLLDHPHLQINSLHLEKKEPISTEDWVSLTKKKPLEVMLPEEDQVTYFLKLIFFSLFVGGLWWIWRQKEILSSFKWLIELSPDLSQKKILIWCSIAAGNYLLGLIFSLIKWRVVSGIFLTLASLIILLMWRSFIWKIRPDLESRYPELAAIVYRGAGGPYIAGFLVTLVTAAFFLIIRLEPVAEQIAVVGYYMLVVGVILEFKTLRKEIHEQKKEDDLIDTEKDATQP